MPSTTTPSAPLSRPAQRPTDETIKETFESIVIAFILAFVFRSYVVEAFVKPTGSMAPTLLGEHVDVRCPQCGYHFTVDVSPGTERTVICPMCHFPITIPANSRLSAGDRILVHKYLYSVVEPQRWDVVVFKDPSNPHTNFIKRLIGLPGESLEIIDGNIYVKSKGEPWHIARKPDRPEVQRAVWQPIYYSDYIPLDGGRGRSRDGEDVHNDHFWATPWRADRPDDWEIEGRRSYHHEGSQPGEIHFDFRQQAKGGMGWYAYNEFRGSDELAGLSDMPSNVPGFRPEPIEDVRVSAKFQAEGPGLTVRIRTTARLDDVHPATGIHILSGRIDADGHAAIEEIDPHGRTLRTMAQGEAGAFTPGVAREVELWYVDQEASLWVDGRRVCVWRFEVDIDALANRRPPEQYPAIAIEVSGAPGNASRGECRPRHLLWFHATAQPWGNSRPRRNHQDGRRLMGRLAG